MPALASTCLNYEQVAMPMVHPMTEEIISSYNRLMRNPTMAETRQTAFEKEFGDMAGAR
jgi:hypothetical protein